MANGKRLRTSNEPFSGWTKTFTDPRLSAAIVGGVTFARQSPPPDPTC